MSKSDFQMTSDEIETFKKSMKNDEFKNLFFEYMNELSDPNNKKLYEDELAKLEAEKGFNVRYVKPVGEFCLKTTIINLHDNLNVTEKTFINICSSPEIDPVRLADVLTGKWDIPYSLSKGREDVDHENKSCTVYDVVFHPSAFEQAARIAAFKPLIAKTALEGIAKQFSISFGKEYKILKNLKCKGVPLMTMIKEKDESLAKPAEETSLEYIEKIAGLKSTLEQKNPTITTFSDTGAAIAAEKPQTNRLAIPKFKIVHQTSIQDYQKFTGEKERQYGARPDSLVIKIELPGIKSAVKVDLDVSEKKLDLLIPEKYKLHLDLPFPVKDKEAVAKFEKASSTLVVTVPVIPAPRVEFPKRDEESIPIEKEEEEEVESDKPEELKGSALIDEIKEGLESLSLSLPTTATNANVDDLGDAVASICIKEAHIPMMEKCNPQPPFHATQSPGSISFIVPISGIFASSLQTNLTEGGEGSLKAIQVDFATGEQAYRLHLVFPHPVFKHECSVSPLNLVLLFLKRQDMLWDRVWTKRSIGEEILEEEMMLSTPETVPSVEENAASGTEMMSISAKQKKDHVVIEATATPNRTLPASAPVVKKPVFVNNCLFDLDD